MWLRSDKPGKVNGQASLKKAESGDRILKQDKRVVRLTPDNSETRRPATPGGDAEYIKIL